MRIDAVVAAAAAAVDVVDDAGSDNDVARQMDATVAAIRGARCQARRTAHCPSSTCCWAIGRTRRRC